MSQGIMIITCFITWLSHDYHLFLALLLMVGTPSLWKTALSFRNFPKKDGSDFSCKNGRVGKWRVCFIKRGFYLFLCRVTVSSVSLCVRCALLNYTISISIFCVSLENFSLIDLINRYVTSANNFYKWVVFEKQRHCGTLNFWYQQIIHSV